MSATTRAVLGTKLPGPASHETSEVWGIICDPCCHCSSGAQSPQAGGAAGRPQAPASVMRAPSHSLCRSFTGTNLREYPPPPGLPAPGSPSAPGSLSAPGWEAMDLRPVAYLLAKPKPASCRSVPWAFFGKSGQCRPHWPLIIPSPYQDPQSFWLLSQFFGLNRKAFLEGICGTIPLWLGTSMKKIDFQSIKICWVLNMYSACRWGRLLTSEKRDPRFTTLLLAVERPVETCDPFSLNKFLGKWPSTFLGFITTLSQFSLSQSVIYQVFLINSCSVSLLVFLPLLAIPQPERKGCKVGRWDGGGDRNERICEEQKYLFFHYN